MKNNRSYAEASVTATKEQVKIEEATFQNVAMINNPNETVSLGANDESYVRRRYSFDNNGGGYQGL